MTQTRKFSQFQGPSQVTNTDIVVGLRTDPTTGRLANWQFTGVGSGGGGGGAVTTIITQATVLAVGQWVRINSAGVYVPAQADSAQDGEVVGVVIVADVPNMQYTIQQSGYITSAQNVFSNLALTGLGIVWFLDTASAGAMVAVDATVNNQVSRPVFVNDTDSSGWVLPYRGLIVGGVAPNSGGGGTTTDSNIVTVNQNGHDFSAGEWLRIDTPIDGQATYVLAQADTLDDSQSVGVVIEVVNANQFKLQFAGYISGGVPPVVNGTVYCPFQDDMGAPLIPKTVYYLSNTEGQITSVDPGLTGLYSKPLFVSEQVISATGLNAGYILPQRPLNFTTENNNVHVVNQVNIFNAGQWVYCSADNTYALAKADTLPTSQVAGLIIARTGTTLTIQQDGWINTAVDGTYVDGGAGNLTSSTIMYLSATNAGNLTNTAPVTVGQFTKPCYYQEQVTGRVGQILPQRPLPVFSGGGGGGILQSVYASSLTQQTFAPLGVSFNAGNWQTVGGGYTATITPQQNTSAIRARLNIYSGSTGAMTVAYRVLRNGVPIASSLTLGGWNFLFTPAGTGKADFSTFEIQDSPGVLTPLVYTFQVQPIGNGAFNYCFNFTSAVNQNSGSSSMILEEIA